MSDPGKSLISDPLPATGAEFDSPELEARESRDIMRMQLILSEKRTSLSVLRTGIAVFTLPLSVATVLIATSRHYNLLENALLAIPLLTLCLGLVILGIYLVHRSMRRLWRQEALIEKIKREDPSLARFFEGDL
ncbi:MAG TPA: hypothetical protein PLZ55_12265 [bacterium]|nr:hypothetical protein [bacterium]HPO09437.1 hypothetical protein [bacterium]